MEIKTSQASRPPFLPSSAPPLSFLLFLGVISCLGGCAGRRTGQPCMHYRQITELRGVAAGCDSIVCDVISGIASFSTSYPVKSSLLALYDSQFNVWLRRHPVIILDRCSFGGGGNSFVRRPEREGGSLFFCSATGCARYNVRRRLW